MKKLILRRIRSNFPKFSQLISSRADIQTSASDSKEPGENAFAVDDGGDDDDGEGGDDDGSGNDGDGAADGDDCGDYEDNDSGNNDGDDNSKNIEMSFYFRFRLLSKLH